MIVYIWSQWMWALGAWLHVHFGLFWPGLGSWEAGPFSL